MFPSRDPLRLALDHVAAGGAVRAGAAARRIDRAAEFALVGALLITPMILMYTAWGYWVLRGKVRHGEGYHH